MSSKLFSNGQAMFLGRRSSVISPLWLLALIPVLCWILAKRKTSQALSLAKSELVESPELFSEEQMDHVVRELSTTLQPPTKVTLPTFGEDSSHIWTSRSGKRVYMN